MGKGKESFYAINGFLLLFNIGFLQKILAETDKPSKTPEPVGVVLQRFFEKYQEDVRETCEINRLDVDSVKARVANLYNISCKRLHGYKSAVVICAKYWEKPEVIALALMFWYYDICFIYYDKWGWLLECCHFPYELNIGNRGDFDFLLLNSDYDDCPSYVPSMFPLLRDSETWKSRRRRRYEIVRDIGTGWVPN